MRSRRSSHSQAADVARRRLELLSAELAAIRSDPVEPPSHDVGAGSGEPPTPPVAPTSSQPPAQTTAPGPPGPSGPPGRHARRAGASRSGGWMEDRLPPTLQGRVRVGPSQLTVVAVLVAAALGFLAWWSVRAADPGELVTTGAATPVTSEVAPLLSTAPGPSPPGPVSPGSSSSAAAAGADLVVDVAGKVRRPGIVRLPAGSRVVDALAAAGGARRGVDLTGLNLARPLVDGEQVLVGVRAVPGVAPSAAAAPGGGTSSGPMVNINAAGADELETLPGVGPVTAAAILQWRADHGAFSAVEELLEVSGIGDATLAEMAPYVTL
jgi:competence protein ComEA